MSLLLFSFGLLSITLLLAALKKVQRLIESGAITFSPGRVGLAFLFPFAEECEFGFAQGARTPTGVQFGGLRQAPVGLCRQRFRVPPRLQPPPHAHQAFMGDFDHTLLLQHGACGRHQERPAGVAEHLDHLA